MSETINNKSRKAYGSITIYDLSDTDKLSVDIEYNHPRDIVWNHVSYNPDFSKNPLVLTPVIYLGSDLLGVDRLKSITWSKKDYNGNISQINSDIDPATGVLTISTNILTEEQLAVTYICDIAYKDLTATNRVSFNLLIQPQPISSISITGDSVFLYDQNNQLKTPNTITLNAKIDDCEVIRWEYRNAQGNWVTIDGSDFKESIIVSESDPYYLDDVATIRVVTNITSVYDIHQIYKIRDGAAGADLLQAVLSNEYINIPCDKDGNVISLSTASIKVSCYLGNDDLLDSSDLLISINKENLQGNFSRERGEFVVTSLDSDVGKAEFTFEYEGEKKITKTLRLNKIYPGQDGKDAEIYYLHLNSSVVNKDKYGNYTPNIIQATAYKNIGNKQEDYSGYIVFYDSFGNKIAGSLDTLAHVSDIDISAIGNQTYEVKLFSSDDINKLLDSQTIVVVSDGDKGDTGDKGEDSVNFIVGNQFEGIPCDKDGKTASDMRIEIPYQAFRGTKRVPCTASIDITSNNAFTVDTETSKDSTNTLPGCIVLRCNAGSDLNNSDKGNFNITLTTKEDTPVECADFSFSWAKVKTGQDGATSPILTIVTPQGNVINNGENSVTLEAKLLDGVDEPTIDNVSWYKFDSDSNEYVSLSGETSKKLIVGKDLINGYGLYKCIVTYKDQPYEAYSQVIDKTDPIQVEIISTLGDKIFDYQATGYLYARVYRNGIELDPLQNLKIGEEGQHNPEIGDVWFDTISNIAKVYKGTDLGWQYFTHSQIASFDWDFIPNNLTSTPESYIGNFLSIDGNISKNYNQIHLSVTLQSGIKGNSNFYIIDSTEGEHLGSFESLDNLNSYIDLYNIVLRPNTKYYNTTDKITYIWNTTTNVWEILVKDGEVGNTGKNADTTYRDPILYYAAWGSNTQAPEFSLSVYSEDFPEYTSSTPYIWNIIAQDWIIYDDDNQASFERRYSTPILLSQLDCVTKWAANSNKSIGEWCSANNVTIVEKGMIATGSVSSKELTTDAIKSSNYVAASGDEFFAKSGTFLDLDNGYFYSKNLYITEDTAKFFGSIESKDYSVSNSGTTISGFKLSSDDGDLLIDSPNLKVDQSGNLEGKKCQFTDGSFQGNIQADTGNIGDFKIQNGSLESDHIVLKPESIYFPTQSIFNLSNDVSIYNEETVSYIATDGNRDFELRNIGGAGIRFKANPLQDTVYQSINITGAKIRLQYIGQDNDGDGIDDVDGYDFYIDFNWKISNSSTLFSPKTITFYVKYTFTVPGTLWKPDTVTDHTVPINLDIPALVGSGSKSVKVCGANSPDLLKWHGITKDANASNDSCNFGNIAFDLIAVSAKNNTLYSLGSFCPNVPSGSSAVTSYVLGNDSHIWQSIRALTASITSSDFRLKNTIKNLTSNYSELFDNLNPVCYKYNDGTSDRTHTGFIAQEVELALNKANIEVKDFAGLCIGTDENKTYSLRYEEFIPLNTHEIQKLKSRITELEAIVEELRSKIK